MHHKCKHGRCPYCGHDSLTDLVEADVTPYGHILNDPNRKYQKCDSCGKKSAASTRTGCQYPLVDPEQAISGVVVTSHAD